MDLSATDKNRQEVHRGVRMKHISKGIAFIAKSTFGLDLWLPITFTAESQAQNDWRERRASDTRPDNKHVIYFYLEWRTLRIEQAGEMREREKRAIKEEIYMEVALLCHMWSYGSWQEPSGHISSQWRGSEPAPPPRAKTMAPALLLCLTPVYYHTLAFCAHSTLFC